MKFVKIISLFIIIPLILASCRRSYADTIAVGERIASSLGDTVAIYSSLKGEGERGYMPDDVREGLFRSPDDLPRDYTVILSKRREVTLEIGIFKSESRSMSLDLCEMLLIRIDEVGEWTDATGDVMMEGNLVIYYVTDTEIDLGSLCESALKK